MRTLSWKRLAVVGLMAAAVPAAMLWVSVRACGPDWEPEVLVTANHPDRSASFAEGHLGILESSYYHAELVIAYRYLSGGKLSDTEKAAYVPAMQASDNPYDWDEQRNKAATSAVNQWLSARAAVTPGTSSPAVSENKTVQQTIGNYSFQGSELNCTDGAFVTAAKTLQARAATWGADSAELKEWLRGQDAVFGNCTGASTMPDAAQPQWNALLRRDRAYQIAAANFYTGNYGDAIAEFVAIGKDKGSPWSRWGEYLAARAEVRKAGSNGQSADFGKAATFDNAGLQAAEARLLKVQSETADPEIRHAAQTELNFILVRLDPSKRLDAAAAALAGPNPDPDFAQDLADLDVLMDRRTSGDSDLVLWIEDMQGIPPKNGTFSLDSVTARWKQKQTLPWMVAALARSPLKAAPSSDLLSAAARVQPGSPGYLTVINYRAQQMLVSGNEAAARPLLSATLASLGPDPMVSARNRFLSLRMQTARNLNEFLADAPRTIIDGSSENAALARCDPQPTPATQQPETAPRCAPQQFDADAAGYLNTQMPLALLEQAAESSALPAHLRQAVAEMAWVRALALNDTAALARMAKLLPGPMRQTAGVNDDFPATLALLKAPGVRPYLDAGVQRSDSFAELDHFRSNWWCGHWTDGSVQVGPNTYSGQVPTVLPPLAFLTPQQREQAAAEATRMNALPQGLVWVGQRVIAYVKGHAEDKADPETLALVVQATRWGCAEYNSPDAQKAVSKEAFELLHSKYPKSEWALKTKYYY